MITSIANAGVQRRYLATSARAMKKFLVIARDHNDSDALNRRLMARKDHLDQVLPRVNNNEVLCGGAMLESHDTGKMIGSVLIFEAESKQDVEASLNNDPYTKGKVWKDWDIYPMIVAVGKVGK